MDMDISMDIHVKSGDMDMDMDVKIHIHGNPVPNPVAILSDHTTDVKSIRVKVHGVEMFQPLEIDY